MTVVPNTSYGVQQHAACQCLLMHGSAIPTGSPGQAAELLRSDRALCICCGRLGRRRLLQAALRVSLPSGAGALAAQAEPRADVHGGEQRPPGPAGCSYGRWGTELRDQSCSMAQQLAHRAVPEAGGGHSRCDSQQRAWSSMMSCAIDRGCQSLKLSMHDHQRALWQHAVE